MIETEAKVEKGDRSEAETEMERDTKWAKGDGTEMG